MNSWLLNRWGQAEGRQRKQKKAARRDAARRRVLFEQLENRSLMAGLVSPVLDTTIEAVNSSQNAYNNLGSPTSPPDSHGAVGPSHVLNVTNQTIQWFTKAGVQQAHTSLTNFFAPLFPAPGLGPFDPKAVYDPYAGRYVVIALEVLDAGNGDPVDTSRILMAVSDDSDPNGTWSYQSINSMQNIGGVGQWLDYPGLAVDSEAVYITGNMFPFNDAPATATAGGSRLWIIGKGQGTGGVYDGGISSANVYNPTGTSAAGAGFTLQPAMMFGNGPTFGKNGKVGTWLMAYNGTSTGGVESVLTVRVDNPLNNPTFFVQPLSVGDIDDTNNTAYPNTPGPLFLPGAPQRGSATLLDFGDRRMMSAVWRNNQLYGTTQVLPGSGQDINQVTVHWFRIDTSNPNQLVVADQGNIGGEDVGSNAWTSYGAVSVDIYGNMAIGFSATSPGMYAGSYYAVRAATDAPGTMRQARTLAIGQDAYDDQGNPSRWGDYSALALDPTNGVQFWAYNEYAQARSNGNDGLPVDYGRYGTRWGAFHLADLPTGGGGGSGGGGGGGSTDYAYITGTKWSDANKNGTFDSTEKGVAGFTIYVDLNVNGKIDIGEPAATTDSNGVYVIKSQKYGSYPVREVPLPGWTQIYPGAAANYQTVVTLAAGQTVAGIDFGNNGVVYDFGDAPAPYPTTLALNGARAGVLTNFHLGPPSTSTTGVALGVEPDAEADGLPDPNALGDDNTGVDDEDGVVFNSNLIAGATASITVTVSTGSSPDGALQGWVDFNGDGDWNDSGEQIFKNKTLSEGSYVLTFPVPTAAKTGTTFARFRYGYEKDLSPTGSSQAGEVEDYQVQVISDQPVATNDTASVNQGSNNNTINVLANDFPSSQGGLRIQSVQNPTNQNGTVAVYDNGTPANPSDDVLLYTTPSAGYIGTDTFTYTITDNSGKTATATVTVNVVSLTNDPIAVDDSFTRATAQIQTVDVLANDVVGKNGPILITSVTQPPSGSGTVSITSGGKLLQYTPPSTSFVGDLQFTYTIQDSASPTPKTSTATVTMHIGATTADDLIGLTLRPYDLNGNPISVIAPGTNFELRAFVQDLRTDDTVGTPTDHLGVYASYFDTLYPASLVSIVGPIAFNGDPSGPWTSGQSGTTTTPGLMDEVGAFEGTNPKFTQNAIELFRVQMRANTAGQATFSTDPADNLPLHDNLLFEPPTPPVGYQQITYGTSTLFIGDPSSVLFKAVDDSLTATATGPTTLQVLNNDLAGVNAPILISALSPVGTFQGAIARSADNKTVVYTAPAGGFTGVQQFDYTIVNSIGETSVARATIFAGTPANLAANDKVKIRLAAWDPATSQEIATITQGSTFQVRAYVSDLRTDDGDGNPNTNLFGVYAAYTDVLYNYKVATFVPNASDSTGFTFGAQYQNGRSGSYDTPGLLNEVGAFETGSSPLGKNEFLLFAATFTADKAGVFSYQGNPADQTPAHDTLLFNPPTPAVGIDEITYTINGSLTITAAGSGEGEFTNASNPLDVNVDGFVTPLDALLIINNMNSYGSRALVSGSGGEAANSANGSRVYLDVNKDKFLSAIDALIVVNFLNRNANGEGEAEATDVTSDLVADLTNPTAAIVDAASNSLIAPTSNSGSAAATVVSNNSSTTSPPVVSQPESKSVLPSSVVANRSAELDDLLGDLASDVAGAWQQSKLA